MLFVSTDQLRASRGQFDVGSDDPMLVTHLVCKRLKQEGYNIAHDGDFARPIARELLAKANGDTIMALWFRVVAPEDVITAHLRGREATPYLPDIDSALATYRRRKAVHESVADLDDIPYLYVFDSARDNIDEQVEEFVQKAHQQLHNVKE